MLWKSWLVRDNVRVDPVQDLLEVEQRWTQAHVDNDIDAIASLMDDAYQKIDDRGALLDREQTLATYTPDTRHWILAESDQHTVRIEGDTAVLTGRWRSRGVNDGEKFDYQARFVSVYVRREDGWKMLFDQCTTIPERTS